MLAGLLFSMLLAAGPQAPAPVDRHAPSDSAALQRIAAALAQPVRLKITVPQPTFHVEIREHPYFREAPYMWNFGGGGVPTGAPSATGTGTPPLVQVDVLPLLRNAVHALSERAAEREVQGEVAAFCATHACND